MLELVSYTCRHSRCLSLSVSLSLALPFSLYLCMSICLCFFLSVFVCVSVCLSRFLSTHVWLYLSLCVCLCFYLSLPVCVCFSLSLYLSLSEVPDEADSLENEAPSATRLPQPSATQDHVGAQRPQGHCRRGGTGGGAMAKTGPWYAWTMDWWQF